MEKYGSFCFYGYERSLKNDRGFSSWLQNFNYNKDSVYLHKIFGILIRFDFHSKTENELDVLTKKIKNLFIEKRYQFRYKAKFYKIKFNIYFF